MDVKIFDKKSLPSRHVMQGPEPAPHSTHDYAMGLTEDQIKPSVGGGSCWNAADAQGTAREFRSIGTGHEGMKSSLVCREVIADSIDATMVGIAGCDKSLPGMMTARVRLNVPSIFRYGGSILSGKFKSRDGTVADVFETVGQHPAGTMLEGETNSIDAEDGRLDLDAPAERLAWRRAEWTPRQADGRSEAVWKYAQQVGTARLGTVTHPGAKCEVIVYADQ